MSTQSMSRLALVLAAASVLACGDKTAPAPAPAPQADAADKPFVKRLPESGLVAPTELARFTSLPDPPIVLDVRMVTEHAAGHVPGSVLVPVQELPKRLAELEEGKTRGVILYCQSGRRARNALGILEGAGFKDLAMIDGSMQGWQSAGLPVEKTAPQSQPSGG